MTATQTLALVIVSGGLGAAWWEVVFCTAYRREARDRQAQIERLQKRLERMERRGALERKAGR